MYSHLEVLRGGKKMKYFLILILLLGSATFATANNKNEKVIKDKHVQEQMEREKKYAKEQAFYKGADYDLKQHEVDMESVRNLPDVENTYEDYDMTHDYD